MPIKILPLGDSITQGQNTSYGSYRRNLYSSLTSAGVSVNFVGGLSDGTFASPRHEGLTGYDINGIWGQVVFGLLETFVPDVILLLIGTNDIWHNIATETPAQALSLYTSLLGGIKSHRATAKVICGSILPMDPAAVGSPSASNVNVFNAGLPAVVSAAGANFYFVDTHASVTLSDLADGVHPTDAGNDKLAAGWFPTVMTVMPLLVGQQLIDDNSVGNFIDDDSTLLFVEDNGNVLGGLAATTVMPLRFRLHA